MSICNNDYRTGHAATVRGDLTGLEMAAMTRRRDRFIAGAARGLGAYKAGRGRRIARKAGRFEATNPSARSRPYVAARQS
jgi:hypothetical protein